jgi:hypothetical protein
VADLQQRWAAIGEPEQALEGDRVVEVAADAEQPAIKCADPDSWPPRSEIQVSEVVLIVTSGRRRVPPLRTRAPCWVHRTSQVRPMSHRPTW